MITLIISPEIPNFIGDKKPTNVNVTDGMDVEFNCETSAKPPATITWFMNGRELTGIFMLYPCILYCIPIYCVSVLHLQLSNIFTYYAYYTFK